MKKTFLSALLFAATFVLTSCESDSASQLNHQNIQGVEFLVDGDNQSRVVDGRFESGDVAFFDAYTANGALHADNVTYTYSDGIFSSSAPISYPSSGGALTFVACYPQTKYLSKNFTYTATADQSDESSYEGNDLLVAKVEASQDLQPTVQFLHAMSSVVITINNSSSYSNIKINAKRSVACDVVAMTFSATGSVSQVTPLHLGGDQYLVMIAPQEVAAGDTFITATINGDNFSWKNNKALTLKAGVKYSLECSLDEDITILPTDTYRTGWAELPNEIVDAGNYYYAHHYATLNGKKVRNFSACYSNDFTCPVWVAGPYHRCYSQGSGDRSNNYKDDPQIPCYQVESLKGDYNRGHMIASSDRLGNQELNNQVFYLSNIAPQLMYGFNQSGSVWNNYEDEIQEWYNSRSDTLYVVNGCHWEPGYKTIKGTAVPTHYYKALLRCKTPNSKKSVVDCSSSELECVAVFLEHSYQHNVSPKASHLISIEELEKKTGFKYFTNVPNAPKGTFSASDWL